MTRAAHLTLLAFIAGAVSIADASPVLLQCHGDREACAAAIAGVIVKQSRSCFAGAADEVSFSSCVKTFCSQQCGMESGCSKLCESHARPLYSKFLTQERSKQAAARAAMEGQAREAAREEAEALGELQQVQGRMRNLSMRIADRARRELREGDASRGREEMAKVNKIADISRQIDEHLANVAKMRPHGFAHVASFLEKRTDHGL
eukprot:TRINITY_DN63571_c0_g1_i1.p1 TRINITY_DN63571_c0_g1~~TRINITY_DN63571_c0_g1_i1.p1  ORF type:complete len:205 (+),score=32.31 TRINITY_DN63571_c0_g1_i1:187-801(+)